MKVYFYPLKRTRLTSSLEVPSSALWHHSELKVAQPCRENLCSSIQCMGKHTAREWNVTQAENQLDRWDWRAVITQSPSVVLQGSMLGPTQFNTYSADPDDGRVCTLSRFTGIAKQEYGQYAAQKDLNRLEKDPAQTSRSSAKATEEPFHHKSESSRSQQVEERWKEEVFGLRSIREETCSCLMGGYWTDTARLFPRMRGDRRQEETKTCCNTANSD